MNIPLNIETLLAGRVVESERLEFKKSWNPPAILRTIAAFANDFENLGSGYIIVGIEEENGMPKRPIYGFPAEDFDKVQKEMLGYCNLIRPTYFPRLSLEQIDDKHVLLIWVSAGSNRPYEVPRDVTAPTKDYQYYIRRYSSTVLANIEEKKELISLTANIPFDDRVNHKANVTDISFGLLQQHLSSIGSRLFDESARLSLVALCRQMNLVEGPYEYILPKNVALMLFNANPEKFFPSASINLVEFPEGVAGTNFIEKHFNGPIQQQLLDVIHYIKVQVIKSKTIKIKGDALSKTFFNYPFEAIEEALANAVYHKNYEIREPIEIRILPESIEIISYGGPDPSIRKDDLNNGIIRARRYRNRRIGEFLKELNLTEGKGTGIPTIKKALLANGSEPAYYDTDGEERRFFVVIIPIHRMFVLANINKSTNEDGNKDGNKDGNIKLKLQQQLFKLNKIKYTQPTIERMIEVLRLCMLAKTNAEILTNIGLSNQTKNSKENIEPLLAAGFLVRTIPDKPTSKNQQYITTTKGKKLISTE